MANITLMGASYTDVPAVTLPQTGGGTVTFYEDGGGSVTVEDEPNATGTTCVITTSAEPEPSVTWETLYEGTPVFYTDAGNYFWIPELANVQPILNSVWRITIDGTAYTCTAKNSLVGVIVGNPVHVGGADDGSGVPVAFYNYNNQAWAGDTTTLSAGTYTVKIERQVSA